MENNNCIQIQGWMVNELKLKSNELIIYAVIHGFSQDGNSEFSGSLDYICSAISCSKTTGISVLKSLVEKGLVLKSEFGRYKVVFPIFSKDIISNNDSMPKIKENKEKTSLFSNSFYSVYENLRNTLKDDSQFVKEYGRVDLKHYIFQVDAWSESSQTKRTERGWLMTLRKWMSDELKSNKLVKLPESTDKPRGHVNY
jgi:uncharacterized protein YsxB (DUF464 family)